MEIIKIPHFEHGHVIVEHHSYEGVQRGISVTLKCRRLKGWWNSFIDVHKPTEIHPGRIAVKVVSDFVSQWADEWERELEQMRGYKIRIRPHLDRCLAQWTPHLQHYADCDKAVDLFLDDHLQAYTDRLMAALNIKHHYWQDVENAVKAQLRYGDKLCSHPDGRRSRALMRCGLFTERRGELSPAAFEAVPELRANSFNLMTLRKTLDALPWQTQVEVGDAAV